MSFRSLGPERAAVAAVAAAIKRRRPEQQQQQKPKSTSSKLSPSDWGPVALTTKSLSSCVTAAQSVSVTSGASAVFVIVGIAAVFLATEAAGQELRCAGVPDGSAACSGCSAAFNGDACGACLMETLNAAPTCTACEGERVSGEPVTVECGPSCFYCRSCDMRGHGHAEMRTPGGIVVETCRCDPARVRDAAAATENGGGSAKSGGVADPLLDGRHGVLQVLPDQTTVATVDGLAVRVTCAKVGFNRYRTLVAPLDGRGGFVAAAAPQRSPAVALAPPSLPGPLLGAAATCSDRGNTYRVVPWSGCSLFVQSGGTTSAVQACPPTTAFDVRACSCVHRGSGLKCCS